MEEKLKAIQLQEIVKKVHDSDRGTLVVGVTSGSNDSFMLKLFEEGIKSADACVFFDPDGFIEKGALGYLNDESKAKITSINVSNSDFRVNPFLNVEGNRLLEQINLIISILRNDIFHKESFDPKIENIIRLSIRILHSQGKFDLYKVLRFITDDEYAKGLIKTETLPADLLEFFTNRFSDDFSLSESEQYVLNYIEKYFVNNVNFKRIFDVGDKEIFSLGNLLNTGSKVIVNLSKDSILNYEYRFIFGLLLGQIEEYQRYVTNRNPIHLYFPADLFYTLPANSSLLWSEKRPLKLNVTLSAFSFALDADSEMGMSILGNFGNTVLLKCSELDSAFFKKQLRLTDLSESEIRNVSANGGLAYLVEDSGSNLYQIDSGEEMSELNIVKREPLWKQLPNQKEANEQGLSDLLRKSHAFLKDIINHPTDPMPLDYSEKSLTVVQEYLTSLNQEGLNPKYVSVAMLAMAVYFGDLLMRIYPRGWFEAKFKDNQVEHLIFNLGNHKIFLLNLVRKAMKDSEGDNIALKFQPIVNQLKTAKMQPENVNLDFSKVDIKKFVAATELFRTMYRANISHTEKIKGIIINAYKKDLSEEQRKDLDMFENGIRILLPKIEKSTDQRTVDELHNMGVGLHNCFLEGVIDWYEVYILLEEVKDNVTNNSVVDQSAKESLLNGIDLIIKNWGMIAGEGKLPILEVINELDLGNVKTDGSLVIRLDNPEVSLNLDKILRNNKNIIEWFLQAFMEMIRKIYDPEEKGGIGPRFERHVRNSFLLIYNNPKLDLRFKDLLDLLMDGSKAQKTDGFLSKINDTELREYWKGAFEPKKFYTNEILGYINTKLVRLLSNEKINKLCTTGFPEVDYSKYKKIIFVVPNLANWKY